MPLASKRSSAQPKRRSYEGEKKIQRRIFARERMRKNRRKNRTNPSGHSRVVKTKEDLSASNFQKFKTAISVVPDSVCLSCRRLLFPKEVRNFDGKAFCSFCHRYIKQQEMSPLDFERCMDPGVIPEELKNLTIVEKRLIAKVHPFLSIVILPGGQFGEKGQVINFPVTLERLVLQFANDIDSDHIIIAEPYSHKDSLKRSHPQSSANNYVRVDKVVAALLYLKDNNVLYRNDPDIQNTIARLQTIMEDSGRDVCRDPDEDMEIEDTQDVDETVVVPVDHVTPNTDIFQKLTGKSKAPSTLPVWKMRKQKGRPLSVLDRKTPFEELAFPHLFTSGLNGINQNRPGFKLSDLQYYASRLSNEDRRFPKDISYLFFALCVTQSRQLNNAISIAMRFKNQQQSARSITAGELSTTELSPDLLENSYAFMSQIRGTAGYWRSELVDLLARVNTKKPPTWFISLSAADTSDEWSDLFDCFKSMGENFDISSSSDRWKLLKENPDIVAKHFVIRWEAFLKHIILGSGHPLGEVVDWYARVEFQKRGSPHLHIFLWIKDAPDLDTEEGRQNSTDFIDRYLTAEIPEDDEELKMLVEKLQIHSHKATCQHRNRCRFDFPQPLSEETRVKTKADPGNPSRMFVFKRRHECDQWVNPYNKTLLRCWRGNMDLQPICSMYGLCLYVCCYMVKAEPQGLKSALTKVFNDMDEDDAPRKKLAKVGNTLLNHREVSAQEATFLLNSDLRLVYSSSQVVFINARWPKKRSRILRPRHIRLQLSHDSTDVFVPGKFDFYANRPLGKPWESMNMFQFFSQYSLQTESNSATVATTLQFDKSIQQRQKECCIRFPRLSPVYHEDEYYYSRLLLFKPWRDENRLLDGHDSAKSCFGKNLQKMRLAGFDKFEFTESHIETALHTVRQLEQENDNLHSPLGEEEESDDDTGPDAGFSQNPFEAMNPGPEMAEINQEDYHQKRDSAEAEKARSLEDDWSRYFFLTMTDDEYQEAYESLTSEQRAIVERLEIYYDNIALGNPVEPIRMFVTGPAGVGKSYLIRFLKEMLLRKAKKNSVLLTAFTGIAARVIHGMTLHSALRLPVRHKRMTNDPNRDGSFRKLPDLIRQQMQKLFDSIDTLIIDEISMVSYRTWKNVHRRLNELKRKGNDQQALFGDMNIICFGDFHQLKPVAAKFLFADITHPFPHLWKTYFERKQVAKYNNKKLKELLKSGQQLFTMPAHHSSSADITLTQMNKLIPKDDSECGGIPNELKVCKTARVMLLRNIQCSRGLVNGQVGTVTDVKIGEHGVVDSIYVKFDDPTAGKIFLDHSSSDHSPIEIRRTTVDFTGPQGVMLTRTQFPLALCWASTIHKVQGLSLESAVISLGSRAFARQMGYVALSRVKNSANVAITDLDMGQLRAYDSVVQEYTQKNAPWSHMYPSF